MERADTTTLDWVETGDGSFTARSGECGELYHSSAGAWSECHEVYVRPFLDEIGARSPVPTRWVVLEIGLGIGLNWLALASAAARRGASLEIVSLEKDARVLAEPLPPRVVAALRRTTAPLGSENPTDEAPPLAEGLVESLETLKRDRSLTAPGIEAQLWFGDAPEQLQRRGEPWRGAFDLVMHDAFSPRSNPECWSDAFLHSIAETCKIGALLLSFSVASRVRRTLESERFDVRKPKGFGHKRERLWACKRDVPQKREEPE